MESLEWWQWIAQFGAAFVFAIVMVAIYVKTMANWEKRYRDHCVDTQEMMKEQNDKLLIAIEENTKATTEMNILLRHVNGRLTANK